MEMNGVGIIHLSDIHIKSDSDNIVNKMEILANSIKNKCLRLEKVIILVTGDIAFHGNSEEYEIAYIIISELIEKLNKYLKKQVEVLFLPGNHDCNFNINTSVRDIVIKSVLDSGEIDDDKINICCSIQREYFGFIKLFGESNMERLFEDKLIQIKQCITNSGNIYFVTINTAWLSKLKEEPGKVYFPIDEYLKQLEVCKDGIVITAFHHPTKWCHPDVANNFDDKIESISDFIFQGHEHKKDTFIKIKEEQKVVYIKAAALQEDSNKDESKFNFVIIDNSKGVYSKTLYSFEGNMYKPEKNEEKWENYLEIVNRKNQRFTLSNENIIFMNDIGSNLKHPRKDKLSLNDIFIYPIVEEIHIEQYDDFKEVQISSSEIVNCDNNKPIIVYGEDKCGKTCLGKKLYFDFYELDCCPIFIKYEDIKGKYINNIENLINNCFKKQYKDDVEKFSQLDNDKKVIIIDDFDKVNLSNKIKEKILMDIFAIYDKTIILCNSMFELQELIIGSEEYLKNTISIRQFRLKKFGFRLRNELINKWNIIGCEDIEGENEILVKNEEVLRRMNTIIGKNFIPSVPFYLMIILQAFEVGNEHNFNDSSYGYYYEYLILQTINRISNKQGDKDAFVNFMVCLAKELYEIRRDKISYEELREFHKNFCVKYRVSNTFKSFINFEEFIEDMCRANILSRTYDMYYFSYKYIYYYSIGKYFGDNIQKNEVQEEVKHIISKIHIEEFANIVMFIVHHTKNEFILYELLECATNVLSKNKLVKLEDDISFINELQNELPQLVIENKEINENRTDKLKKLDQHQERIENSEVICDSEDDDSELDKINELNFAFKTMEILGQILKNYWGCLDGNVREEVGVALYEVGLRSLRETYDIFNDARENLFTIIENEIEKKRIIDKTDIEKKVKSMLFLFASFFTQSCINKISSCVGEDKLSETYKDIEKRIGYNSVKLINLSIKLQYFGGQFPYSNVEKLLKENKNNIMGTFLIKHMVRNYLYMYQTNISEKNKIAALVNLPIRSINIHNAHELAKMRKV